MVRYSQLYWDYLKRWREAAVLFRPLYMPMIQPPRPWPGHTGGGYLSIGSTVSTVAWERWPEVSKRMLPCVLNSINLLQDQAYQLDHAQVALTEACWNLGHEIGALPKRDRISEPVDAEFREQGLGPSAYWKAVWKWKSDQRKDSQRSRFINALIAYHRLEEAPAIWFVWHMDHRGRLYSRGAQLNIQGPDHLRCMTQFQERSPIKGHEKAFAWSLGEAVGTAPHPQDRLNYLELMSPVLARVGGDPLGNVGYWEQAKEPWRLIQLCRDWFHYTQDPSYCSGTIHWLDQTCSGWGHVACLTGDGILAQYTNVIGSKPADLYLGIGRLVETRIRWQCEQEHPENKLKAYHWWREHQIPRSLWKKTLMPVIYGRSYLSLAEAIKIYLRDEVGDFLTDEGLRVLDLALVLATTVNAVVAEALPHVKGLSRWLTHLSNLQIDAGLRPYWFTPNGMAIESYQSATERDTIELNLAKRTIRVNLSDNSGCKPDKRKTARKLVPDYIHSMDAAFLQRFVSHWGTYKHPISTIHDCFGTTLEHVETLQSELNDQWHRFYSVDWLTKHQGMVESLVGQEVLAPPIIGTLDRSRIGENSYLFC
jgi:DNA-directed RNA polymerase